MPPDGFADRCQEAVLKAQSAPRQSLFRRYSRPLKVAASIAAILAFTALAAWFAAERLAPDETASPSIPAAAVRIVRPLGLKDTTFRPTEEQLSRRIKLATVKRGKSAAMRKEPTKRDWMQPPFNGKTVFPSAEAGMWSTARDQLKFFRMLMNLGMGENGARILKEETVKKYFAKTIRPEGLGCYGLGVAAPLQDTPGGWYGMGGAWGTDCSVNYHSKSLKLWVVQLLGERDAWNDVRHEAEERFFEQTIDDSSVKAYTGRLK